MARKLSGATPSYKVESMLQDHQKMLTVRRLREKKSHRFLDISKIESILNQSSKKWLQDRSMRIDESLIAVHLTGERSVSQTNSNLNQIRLRNKIHEPVVQSPKY